MKKTALILALFMLFTLAFSACAKSDPVPAATQAPAPTAAATAAPAPVPATQAPAEPAGPTEEDLKNSKPNEYVKEKLDAGMDVLIGCSMIADVPILMEVWAGQIEDVIKPLGFQWQINAAGGDTGVMISQIENYATMGAAMIILVPPDKDSIKDAVLKAQDAGTYCVTYGVEGVDYCYSVRTNVVSGSQTIAHMAIAWAKMTFPEATADNPVKCAAVYNTNVADAKKGGEMILKTLDDDPVCQVVFKVDSAGGSIDSGYTAAQNALTFDAGIRVFANSQGLDALGESNYILAQPGLDYSKYATFGQNSNPACFDAIQNLAPNNQAVYRGTAEYKVKNGTALANCTLKALFGEWPCPYEDLMPGSCVVQPGWDFAEEFR